MCRFYFPHGKYSIVAFSFSLNRLIRWAYQRIIRSVIIISWLSMLCHLLTRMDVCNVVQPFVPDSHFFPALTYSMYPVVYEVTGSSVFCCKSKKKVQLITVLKKRKWIWNNFNFTHPFVLHPVIRVDGLQSLHFAYNIVH